MRNDRRTGVIAFALVVLAVCGAVLSFAERVPTSQEGSGETISARDAKELLSSDRAVVLLDVRTAEEYAAGHIPESILLPYDEITGSSASKVIPEKETPVIVYCRSGRRSALAADTLRKLGYRSVRDLGGINAWPYEVVK